MSENPTSETNPRRERQIELQLGGRHLALVLGGLVLSGALLFFLGRWSGRAESPPTTPTDTIEETGLTEGKETSLTFYETLGKKEDAGFRAPSERAEPKEKPVALPAPPPASEASSQDAGGAAPPRASALSGSSAASDRYQIQVSAGRDPRAAKSLADRLRKRGYPATVETARFPDGRAQYRVRVGNYTDRDRAERAAAKLRSEEKMGAWIVKDQG